MMQTPQREKRGSQAGLTLVELLVAMTISTIIGTMLVGSFISLQRSYAFAQRANTARAAVRDALGRFSSEFRDAQPPNLSDPSTYPVQSASEYACTFYSSYNQAGVRNDASTGNTTLRLTKIYLSGSTDYKTLYWQRDTNNDGALTTADRTMVLATNVVNGSSKVNIPYIFTYYYIDPTSGNMAAPVHVLTDVAKLQNIVAVQLRLASDSNLGRTPNFIDLSATVDLRNAAENNPNP